MKTHLRQREVCFAIQDGCLVRTVVSLSGDGRSYTQRCDLSTYQTVAHALDEVPAQGQGTSLMELAQQEQLPFTQVNIALEFMKERGIVQVRHRRCYLATVDAYLDAMTEWHALAEEARPGHDGKGGG